MVIITDSEQTIEDTSSIILEKDMSKESVESICGPEEEHIQIFSKQMLQNRLFVGHYQERRLVEFIGSYRDVVIVHKSEVDLKRDLCSVRTRLSSFYCTKWIGITGPQMAGAPAATAVWVKLENLPFGHYWFQIKQVKFREREIYIRLKMIRPLTVSDPVIEDVKPPIKTESQHSFLSSTSSNSSTAFTTSSEKSVEMDWTESLAKWRNTIVEQCVTNVTTYATLHNVKETLCFVTAMFMAAFTGMLYSVQYAGDFSIKFMREVSLFLQASTPIILGVIEFFSKLVGGLYLLLAMMWRGGTNLEEEKKSSRTALRSSYVPPYTTPYPYRALPAPPPSLEQTLYKRRKT